MLDININLNMQTNKTIQKEDEVRGAMDSSKGMTSNISVDFRR